MSDPDYKECRRCSKYILQTAVKCPYCKTRQISKPKNKCLHCRKHISITKTHCDHCQERLSQVNSPVFYLQSSSDRLCWRKVITTYAADGFTGNRITISSDGSINIAGNGLSAKELRAGLVAAGALSPV